MIQVLSYIPKCDLVVSKACFTKDSSVISPAKTKTGFGHCAAVSCKSISLRAVKTTFHPTLDNAIAECLPIPMHANSWILKLDDNDLTMTIT